MIEPSSLIESCLSLALQSYLIVDLCLEGAEYEGCGKLILIDRAIGRGEHVYQ